MNFADIEIAWPWLAVLLPLPWVARYLLPATRSTAGALRLPDPAFFPAASPRADGANPLAIVLAGFCWLLLVAAATRPQVLGDELNAPATGRNLMLAIDLSGSMDVNDFSYQGRRANRLQVTKRVASKFIERRAGDRLGLILFGERAYLQVPLTFDRKTVQALLQESEVRLAGEKTAIGDAIGLAVKRLRAVEADAGSKVLVLLTDGANTAGNIEPRKAAELAAANELKIYTIGIGAERMDIASSLTGRIQRLNPSTDLDEDTLRAIADMTGGTYFRATDTRSLEAIYAELDALEPAASDEQGFRPVVDLYYWPLGASLTLLAAVGLWSSLARLGATRRGAMA